MPERPRLPAYAGDAGRLVPMLVRGGKIAHSKELQSRLPLNAAPRNGLRHDRVVKARKRILDLFFKGRTSYIESAGLPAMAINGYRNKPFGPGGGTRRLHQKPVLRLQVLAGGELGSTRA